MPRSPQRILPMQPQGLAARAAHWSARHRKTAIFGWLAFVAIAFVIGGVGRHQVDPRRGHGQRLLEGRRPGDRQGELPRQGLRAGARAVPHRPARRRPGLQGRRRRRRRSSRPHGPRDRDRIALRQGQPGPDLQGRPLRARQLQHPGRHRRRQGARRRDPRDDRRRAAGPPAAAHRAVRRRVRRQGALEVLRRRLPEGRDALAADHAADPDRRLRRSCRRRRPAAARA